MAGLILGMDSEKLAVLVSDDRLKIKALYNENRDAFIAFGKKYGLDEQQLKDVYQESFVALRTRAMQGKLRYVKSSIKTYLFGIGKFKIFDILKSERNKVNLRPELYKVEEGIDEIQVNNRPPLTAQQRLLQSGFRKLGEKCREVLTMFYYRGLSIKEIVLQTNYTNENVVKAHKSRCLKNLKLLCNQGADG